MNYVSLKNNKKHELKGAKRHLMELKLDIEADDSVLSSASAEETPVIDTSNVNGSQKSGPEIIVFSSKRNKTELKVIL